MTKNFLFALFYATRLTRLVARLNRRKVTILCYHTVTRKTEVNRNDRYKLRLPVDSFTEHLDYLQAHYQIISLAEFVRARRENLKLPPSAAILTFDDGMRNFLTVVAPLLLERGIPATSFIVTGASFTQDSSSRDSNWQLEDDDTYLSWNEVRELAKQGIHFGSHTCTHAALPDVHTTQARNELEDSLKALNSHLGQDSFALSYPHGRTSERIIRLTESVGYSCALTIALGQNDSQSDLFALRRTVIASDDDLPTFAARLSGLTAWYARIVALFKVGTTATSESATACYDQIEEFES